MIGVNFWSIRRQNSWQDAVNLTYLWYFSSVIRFTVIEFNASDSKANNLFYTRREYIKYHIECYIVKLFMRSSRFSQRWSWSCLLPYYSMFFNKQLFGLHCSDNGNRAIETSLTIYQTRNIPEDLTLQAIIS
jgi:hypothetical protein